MEARAQLYDQIYHSFYDSTLTLYQDQYPLFGDPEVLPVKVLWDYTYYWGVLSQLFFHDRLCDLALLGSLRDELVHCQQLNVAMQAFLRAWSAVSDKRNPAAMLDQAALPWFAELNASLNDPLDDAGIPGAAARVGGAARAAGRPRFASARWHRTRPSTTPPWPRFLSKIGPPHVGPPTLRADNGRLRVCTA